MSDAPKKRPWLQYHLSTAVVLMLVAAGLLWLNMRDTEEWPRRHGWPCWITERREVGLPIIVGPNTSRTKSQTVIMPWGVVADSLVALAILLAVASLLEWRIRRLERRQ